MGRTPCCDKTKVKRGPWSPEEDTTLKNYVEKYGTGGNWIALPHKAGLKRCGKSCRLRWLNYLRPDIKHGSFTEEEDNTILTLYSNIGSRWSVIASQLPGRTDNDVKNYWNTKLKKKISAGKIRLDNTTNSNNNNGDISTNNSMHFSSTSSPATKDEAFSTYGKNSSAFSYQMDVNPQQNPVQQPRIFDPFQFPLPRFMEVQEKGTSHAYSSLSVSSSQEVSVSTLSPSFSLENHYVSCSGNAGGEDDGFLMDLGSASPYSSLLANISDTDPSQGLYQSFAN